MSMHGKKVVREIEESRPLRYKLDGVTFQQVWNKLTAEEKQAACVLSKQHKWVERIYGWKQGKSSRLRTQVIARIESQFLIIHNDEKEMSKSG